MAHCPYEKLKDLESILKEIRAFERIKEKQKGIFYLKSKGFLHFHVKGDERWADVRNGNDWGTKIDAPFGMSANQEKVFLREIRRRYEATLNG